MAFQDVDDSLESESYVHSSGWSVKKRIRVISTILLGLALLEHLLSWASFLNDRLIRVKMCDWEIGSYFYYIATTHLHQVYAKLPVNYVTVIWAEYMNISFTFTWNFIDLFIIIISIGIASKFKKINTRLEFVKGRVSQCEFESFNQNFLLFIVITGYERQVLGRDSVSLQSSVRASGIR